MAPIEEIKRAILLEKFDEVGLDLYQLALDLIDAVDGFDPQRDTYLLLGNQTFRLAERARAIRDRVEGRATVREG